MTKAKKVVRFRSSKVRASPSHPYLRTLQLSNSDVQFIFDRNTSLRTADGNSTTKPYTPIESKPHEHSYGFCKIPNPLKPVLPSTPRSHIQANSTVEKPEQSLIVQQPRPYNSYNQGHLPNGASGAQAPAGGAPGGSNFLPNNPRIILSGGVRVLCIADVRGTRLPPLLMTQYLSC